MSTTTSALLYGVVGGINLAPAITMYAFPRLPRPRVGLLGLKSCSPHHGDSIILRQQSRCTTTLRPTVRAPETIGSYLVS